MKLITQSKSFSKYAILKITVVLLLTIFMSTRRIKKSKTKDFR